MKRANILTVVAVATAVVILSPKTQAQAADKPSNARPVVVVEGSSTGQSVGRDLAAPNASIVVLGDGGQGAQQQRRTGPPVNTQAGVQAQDQAGSRASSMRARFTRRFFVTDLGTLGGTESFAYALNDLGQVVGSSRIAGDEANHSFLYSRLPMVDLSPLNSGDVQTVGPTGINLRGQIASGVVENGVYLPAILNSRTGSLNTLGSLGGVTSFGFNGVATAINNAGHAVGYSYVDDTTRHAFVYRNGAMTDLGSFGGYSAALSINNRDVIVGFASDTSTGSSRAFINSSGTLRGIGPVTESTARDINDWGQVVGSYLTADQTAFHGFLFHQGAFTDISMPESPQTDAFAINLWGEVVGSYAHPFESVCFGEPCIEYEQHAFIFEGRDIADLNDLIPPHSGWELDWAFDVNNLGQIAGYGEVNEKFRAFLLTPAVSKLQCKFGGWKKFGFKNQGQCIRFVNTGR